MKRFHIAIGVRDIEQSVDDYSARLGCKPSLVVANEYALWRTPAFGESMDSNGIVWETFTAELQSAEIAQTWPGLRAAT